MSTVWSLPQIEFRDLASVQESRPTALLTGVRSWEAVRSRLNLPAVIQAEPDRVDLDYLDNLAEGVPSEIEVIYGVGTGVVADVAKYLGYKRGLPVVLIPTALTNDGLLTPLVAARTDGTVHYVSTGAAETMIIDWQVIQNAPRHLRGAAIVELLTIVTGIRDWQYANDRGQGGEGDRYVEWAAGVMASIARQAFKIAPGIGRGNQESLRTLLDLLCMEVQLSSQLGHNRSQEGSEQYFAYAIESRVSRGRPLPYADAVAPGVLIAAALHKMDVKNMRDTLLAAGLRLGQLRPDDIMETLRTMPDYVKQHNLPYTILNDLDTSPANLAQIMSATGLGVPST